MNKSLDFAKYLYNQGTFDYTELSLKDSCNKEDLLEKKKFIKNM